MIKFLCIILGLAFVTFIVVLLTKCVHDSSICNYYKKYFFYGGGLIFTLLGGCLCVEWIMDKAREKYKNKINGISNLPKDLKIKKRNEDKDKEEHEGSGWIIGWLERILFFIAIWRNAYVLVGAYLAFKVAAKWEAWKNITKVPDSVPERSESEVKMSELDYLYLGKNGAHTC